MPDTPVNITFKARDRASAIVRQIGRGFHPGLSGKIGQGRKALDSFGGKLNKIGRGFQGVGRAFRGVGVGMTAGITAPVALFGKSVVDSTVEFQKSMNRVEAKSQATGKLLKDLENKALALGSSTAFSAKEAADGMAFLAQAGFKPKEILESIGPLLNLAASDSIELAEAADIASNIMGGFKIKASESARVADVLASVTSSSNVNLTQLGETMKNAAPVAAKFGASLEETAAVAGLLGNVGIQGSDAGTALKRMFLGLAAPTSKARKLFKQLGIEAVGKDGKLRSLTGIMGDFSSVLTQLPPAQRLAAIERVFGKLSIAGAAEIASPETIKNLKGFKAALDDSEGAAQRQADTLLKGSVGSFVRFKSALEGMRIAIGKSGLVDFFASAAEGATKIFTKISQTNPMLLKLGSVIAILAAAIGPALIGLSMLTSSFGAAFKAAGFFMKSLSILLGPVGITVFAIGALGFAFFRLLKNFGDVKAGILIGWNAISDAVEDGVDSIARKLTFLNKFIPDFVKEKFGFKGFGLDIKSDEQKRRERMKRDLRIANLGEKENMPTLGTDLLNLLQFKAGKAFEGLTGDLSSAAPSEEKISQFASSVSEKVSKIQVHLTGDTDKAKISLDTDDPNLEVMQGAQAAGAF